jgi:hypothetical protein
MAYLISKMRKAQNYNFDWSISNEEDEAIGAFPRAIIDPRDVLADKETSKDTLAGIGSNDYTNEVLFTILVSGELPAFSRNPSFAIRSTLRLANDDLKKLFGINNQLNGNCDNILYVGSQIEPIRTNDVLGAAQLRTLWRVTYSQDRQDPTLYASS